MSTILFLIFALIVIGAIKNLFDKVKTAPVGDLPGDGIFEQEVVGESHYQDALKKIKLKLGSERICKASLVLEDDNEHDNMAVGVFIEDMKVGHLSRADARKFRAHLKKNAYPEGAYTCNARLCGGEAGKASIGVWLDVYR